MLNEKIVDLLLDHKEEGKEITSFKFKFAKIETTSKKYSRIFDCSVIQKLYRLKDALSDLPDYDLLSTYICIKLNRQTRVKVYNIKNLIIFLSILRDNNGFELEANLDWLRKNC